MCIRDSSKAVAQGIEDALAKKEPRIKDEDMIEAFSFLQNRAEERMTALNKEAAEAGKKFLEENGKREGVVTTASGLQYEVIKKTDGAQPKESDVVTVHYLSLIHISTLGPRRSICTPSFW